MAAKFVLTAQLQLQSPNNVKQVLSEIQSQLKGGVSVNIKANGAKSATADINSVTRATKQATDAASAMGQQFGLSLKRFAGFAVATRAVSLFTNRLAGVVQDAIDFQHEMVKISQVTGESLKNLKSLEKEVSRLASTFGTSSRDLLDATQILAQAGVKAHDLKIAMEVLAKTTLAPTFDNIRETAEGVVAILAQFGKGAAALESQLGAINAVSAQFAVESEDLIDVVRRTGGVFKASGGNLNELIALFTSVRATTRESAESIATGLRTIFTRIQRPATIEFLKQFGVSLTDLNGKFVGPYEAMKRLSAAFDKFGEGDIRFIKIAEELGGFRQIGKVIPLLRQFETAQDALNVAKGAGNSLDEDAIKAQQSLAVQLTKVREEFAALIRSITDTATFQVLVKTTLTFASALIKVADAIKPIIPLIATFAAFKFAKGAGNFVAGIGAGLRGNAKNQGGMIQAFARGGIVPGSGNRDTVPAMLTPGEFVIRKSSVDKIGTDRLSAMNEKHYAFGGFIQKFATKGKVESLTLTQQKKQNQQTMAAEYLRLTKTEATESQIKKMGKNPALLAGFVKDFERDKAKRLKSETPSGIPEFGAAFLVNPSKSANIPKGVREVTVGGEKKKYKLHSVFIDKGDADYIQSKIIRGKANRAINETANRIVKPPGQKVDPNDRGVPNLPAITGSIFEGALSKLSGIEKLGVDESRTFDFPVGLKAASDVFGADASLLANMPTEIKYASSKSALKSINKKVANYLKDNNTRKFASGGDISDTVPALLTPGEFVINKKAAAGIGHANLDRMNKKGVVGFAKGGSVGVQKFADGGGVGLGKTEIALIGLTALTSTLSSLVDETSSLGKIISGATKVLAKVGAYLYINNLYLKNVKPAFERFKAGFTGSKDSGKGMFESIKAGFTNAIPVKEKEEPKQELETTGSVSEKTNFTQAVFNNAVFNNAKKGEISNKTNTAGTEIKVKNTGTQAKTATQAQANTTGKYFVSQAASKEDRIRENLNQISTDFNNTPKLAKATSGSASKSMFGRATGGINRLVGKPGVGIGITAVAGIAEEVGGYISEKNAKIKDQALQEGNYTKASEAFGTERTGSAISSIASSAGTGAMIGSIFGPWGTAIGAAVGGIYGFVKNLNESEESLKEFNKSVINAESENSKERQAEFDAREGAFQGMNDENRLKAYLQAESEGAAEQKKRVQDIKRQTETSAGDWFGDRKAATKGELKEATKKAIQSDKSKIANIVRVSESADAAEKALNGMKNNFTLEGKELNNLIRSTVNQRKSQEALTKANLDALVANSAFNRASISIDNMVSMFDRSTTDLERNIKTIEASQESVGIDATKEIQEVQKAVSNRLGGNNTQAGRAANEQFKALQDSNVARKNISKLTTVDFKKDVNLAKEQARTILQAGVQDGKTKEVIDAAIDSIEDFNDVEGVIKKLQESLKGLNKGATDAAKALLDQEKKIRELTLKKIEAENKYIDAKKRAIDVELEAAKNIEEFGGAKVTGGQKVDALNRQLNLDLVRTGDRVNNGGSPAEIARIQQSLAAKSLGASSVGTLTEDQKQAQEDVVAIQGKLVEYSRKRVELVKQEIDIEQKKLKLEQDSYEKLLNGDFEGFIRDQNAAGAAAAVASGDQSLISHFGPAALGGALRNAREAGASAEEQQKLSKAALGSVGITDQQSVDALAGTNSIIKQQQKEGIAFSEIMKNAASAEADNAAKEVKITTDIVNIAARMQNTTGQDVPPAQGKYKGGLIYANRGVFVPRGTDTVPAMLTPGEFVVNRNAVNRGNNLQILRSMNGNGQSQGAAMARGGMAGYYAGGGFIDSFNRLTSKLGSSFSSPFDVFSSAVDRLLGFNFKVKLDPVNVTVTLNGSILSTLSKEAKDEVLKAVVSEIQVKHIGDGTHEMTRK